MPIQYFPIPKFPSHRRTIRVRKRIHDQWQTHSQYAMVCGLVQFDRISYIAILVSEWSFCCAGSKVEVQRKEKYFKIYKFNIRQSTDCTYKSKRFKYLYEMSTNEVKFRCHRTMASSADGNEWYAILAELMPSINGTATTERSLAMCAAIGCSHPSVHSMCASKNTKILPYNCF